MSMLPVTPSPKRAVLATIIAAALLGVIVHLDWHLGRPAHHGLSGDWSMHWLAGVLSGAGYALWAARVAPTRTVPWLIVVVLLGLFIGQIVEPAFELLYPDMTWALVLTPERWRIFAEFTVAFLIAGGLVLALRAARPLQGIRAQS